jgi:hypothetical protein
VVLQSWGVMSEAHVLGIAKRALVFSLLGLILLIAGSFIAVDWMIFFYGIHTVYAGVAKPVTSFICLLLVLLIGRDGIDRRDTALLAIAFVCIVPVDILMSVVVLSPGMTVASPAFMAGGVLSIIAHLLLIVRHGRGFPYFRSAFRRENGLEGVWPFVGLPLLAYGACAAALLPLLQPMITVGHVAIGLIYSACVATSVWIAWETVRFKLYPKPNAWMIGIAMTCWFITEIIGEIYNIQIGMISKILFNFVWVFYGTTIACLALSGYRWNGR